MDTAYPEVAADRIGWLTEEQMIEVDRLMIAELGIDLVRMMENAGRNLAQLVIDLWAPRSVVVLCGPGGNGGGGLVAARHLSNRGVDVSVTLASDRSRLGRVPGEQFEILQRMGVRTSREPDRADVVVDALIGYSLSGAPRGRFGELITAIPGLADTVASLDTPSGLDVTDGSTPGLAVDADATLTLALPKVGLRRAPQVGDLHVGDISVPPGVYERLGVGPAPDFGRSPIVRVRR